VPDYRKIRVEHFFIGDERVSHHWRVFMMGREILRGEN
jgi:hypothetical protein